MDLAAIQVDKLVPVIQAMGGLDVLLNNAGFLVKKPFSELDRSDWEKSLAINLLGPAEMIRICLPFLEKSERAHIVNIGSMGGFPGAKKFDGLVAYGASKAGLANLTETLAEPLAQKGIAINCLALGAVQTDMLAQAFPGFAGGASTSDMGRFLTYFCTEGQGFFHGKVLPVSRSNP
jgi:NAD(P)-dependent dehydrogenase (short-subunit alcohol dehydrogenase family)